MASVSSFARVAAMRGQPRQVQPIGLCVHTTGGGIVRRAIEAQRDPGTHAVEFYAHGSLYPNYLILWDGDVVSLAADDRQPAAAKWEPWEREVYRADKWQASVERDGNSIAVAPSFYAWWRDRWIPRGFPSPWMLYRFATGVRDPRDATPNRPWIHVEMLDRKPFTVAQVDALARLFVDRARAWQWLDPADIDPATLPQPWLLSHADLSPCRRSSNGAPYDPLLNQLDWGALGASIVAHARSDTT